MSRKVTKKMLLVCEGTQTEPQYFRYLKEAIKHALNPNRSTADAAYTSPYLIDLAAEDSERFFSDIEVFGDTTEYPMKGNKGGKRHLDTTHDDLFAALYGSIDGEHKRLFEKRNAQPLRYVIKAFSEEHENSSYDELWAVFDKNGHTAHQEAFEVAKKPLNGKVVNIAFSSRSFEYWILLHFERNRQVFPYTECKEKRNPIGCGLGGNRHSSDCTKMGAPKCLAGYIRVNTPLANYAKSHTSKALIETMRRLLDENCLLNAFENAAYARFKAAPKLEAPYLMEPYTDVDRLVKKILGIHTEFIWSTLGTAIDLKGFKGLTVNRTGHDSLRLEFSDISIHPSEIKCYIKDRQRHRIDLKMSFGSFDEARRNGRLELIGLGQIPAHHDFCMDLGQQLLLIELES